MRVERYTEGKENIFGIEITETVYDKDGNFLRSYSYNSLAPSDKTYTENETDESGRTVAEYDATGKHKTKYTYFADGSLASETLPNGAVLAYAYDEEGNQVSVTSSTESGEGNTNITHYTAGLVTRVESGNHVVDYVYDGKRRLTKVKKDGADYVSYVYDVDDENYGITDAIQVIFAGSTEKILLNKDEQERLTKYFVENQTMTNVAYENDGRIKSMYDNYGLRLREYSYDDERRLTGYFDLRCMESEMTYDERDRVSTRDEMAHPLDASWQQTESVMAYEYSYDDVHGRVATVKANGVTLAPTYDILGRSTGKKLSVGTSVKASEEIAYLKQGDHTTSLPSVMKFKTAQGEERIKYSYDAMGNIIKISENGIVSSRYEYDALGRLTREDNRAFGKTSLWEYDENGNILSRREYAFTVKSTEELTEIEPQNVVEYKYNGDRLISYHGNTQFVYNALGNPTKYNGKSVGWTYGRHLSAYNGKSILYDGTNIPNKIGDRGIAHDQNGNIVSDCELHFMRDHEGNLFGFMVRDTGTKYLYRRDVLGNIIAVLDTNGNVVVEYKYNAWGNFKVLDANGNEITDETHIGYLNPIRYRGYYYSDDLGLYYLKSRFYDPEVGRFISADTVDYLVPDTVNGLNLYAYCNNNPVMNVDPSGHFAVLSALIFAALFLCTPVGGVVTQVATSVLSYAGMAIASLWDEEIRNDMNAIGWNPFNSDASLAADAQVVSFYKGVPVFRHSGKSSFSFAAIFLGQTTPENMLLHEYGHTKQQLILGPLRYALKVGLPSLISNAIDCRTHMHMPWEVSASILGGALMDPYTEEEIEKALWFFFFFF